MRKSTANVAFSLSFKSLSWALSGMLILSACSASDRSGPDDETNGQPMDPSRPPAGPRDPNHDGKLSGTVYAPEGTIPISGALVYVSLVPPPAIPDGVFCDRCVHLPDGTPYTTTRPDGSFELAVGSGSAYLVVQKGAFRRVRKLDINPGQQVVPKNLTTMPPIMDKANGDDVPKMAVILGAWDPIEVVLARMGLQAVITKALGKAQVLSKDATGFAIYGLHGLGEKSPHPPPLTLLTDPKEISKYHIVFIPCSGGTNLGGEDPSAPKCTGVFNSDPRVRTNLTSFVAQGGRIYASDWSYEYVRQLFPGFVSFRGATSTIGSACQAGGGEQSVTQRDTGLGDWLTAQGRGLSSVKDAWMNIDGVHAVMGTDADGKPATVTPKVWVEAERDPAATSFHHGCGRVLYSTYHTQPTSETNAPLEPQALALLYLILEVGVCIDPMIPG
jgi:hypothetical protein